MKASVDIIDNLEHSRDTLMQQNTTLTRDVESLPSLRARCAALEKQLSMMPTSLTVAGAQLRVMVGANVVLSNRNMIHVATAGGKDGGVSSSFREQGTRGRT